MTLNRPGGAEPRSHPAGNPGATLRGTEAGFSFHHIFYSLKVIMCSRLSQEPHSQTDVEERSEDGSPLFDEMDSA